MCYCLFSMARARKTIDKLGEASILIERLKKEKGWQRERLLVIKAAMEGDTLRVLSKRFSRSHTTVQDWINRFREGGVSKLLDKRKGNGPVSKLTPEMETRMRAELAKGKWRTARDAWNWLCENYDTSDLKESVIYKYLGKCGGRLKTTRPCNPKKDKALEAAFRVELADKMEALKIPLDKNVRLWVYDEMRYGLLPLTRKMWCLRGVRAIAPSRMRYQNSYLYGALEVGGDSSEFLFTPNLNKQWDLKFLEQLSQSDLDSVHVIVGDGAGFHHKGDDSELPENIRIITLPPYSPELNPAEKLWDIVKDGICNKDWEDLAELEESITARIKPYWEEPSRVKSLIGSSYLTSELNATILEELIQFN